MRSPPLRAFQGLTWIPLPYAFPYVELRFLVTLLCILCWRHPLNPQLTSRWPHISEHALCLRVGSATFLPESGAAFFLGFLLVAMRGSIACRISGPYTHGSVGSKTRGVGILAGGYLQANLWYLLDDVVLKCKGNGTVDTWLTGRSRI